MLASSSSSGEPGEVPFHGQVTSENLPITMIAPAEAQPAPHTSSPGRTMAIGRRRSYAKTTPRTQLERVFAWNGAAPESLACSAAKSAMDEVSGGAGHGFSPDT